MKDTVFVKQQLGYTHARAPAFGQCCCCGAPSVHPTTTGPEAGGVICRTIKMRHAAEKFLPRQCAVVVGVKRVEDYVCRCPLTEHGCLALGSRLHQVGFGPLLRRPASFEPELGQLCSRPVGLGPVP